MISTRLVGNGDADLPAPELGDGLDEAAELRPRLPRGYALPRPSVRRSTTILASQYSEFSGFSFVCVCRGWYR